MFYPIIGIANIAGTITIIKYYSWINVSYELTYCCRTFYSFILNSRKQTSNKPFIPKHSILVSWWNDICFSILSNHELK